MNNFDWLHGTWKTTQRKTKPFSGDEWVSSDGTLTCHNLFDGAANVDEVDLPGFGYKGVSLRLLDPATQEWSIYWVDSRTGQLGLPPVIGHFENGVGEFFSDEEWEGRQIRVRYRWSNITPTTARWEQAFSTDEGKTWETNWESDFTR